MFTFIYVRYVHILHLGVLMDRTTGRPFLHWQPTD